MDRSRAHRRGFSLVELLIVLGVIAALIGIALIAYGRARTSARRVACMNQLRQIGLASTQYTLQHNGLFPRSSHSSYPAKVRAWGRALMPQLGYIDDAGGPVFQKLFATLYRCPDDRRSGNYWSYGKNVYPELSAGETGGPTWTRLALIRQPSATVLYGEVDTSPGADHFMAHFWTQKSDPEIDRARHRSLQNFVFVDGHVESLRAEQTFDPSRSINQWNPQTAK